MLLTKRNQPALQEAERASIPVIAIDSNVEDKDLIASIVESDNVAMGKMAGADTL